MIADGCNDAQEIRRIRHRLVRWGRKHYQPFDWREESSPWLTLVAEFLLQRTRASQVIPVFREVRERYPTAAALVEAGPAAAALNSQTRCSVNDPRSFMVSASGLGRPASSLANAR